LPRLVRQVGYLKGAGRPPRKKKSGADVGKKKKKAFPGRSRDVGGKEDQWQLRRRKGDVFP